MRFTLLAVGKIKDKSLLKLIGDYTKRFPKTWPLDEVHVKEGKHSNTDLVKAKEADALLKALDSSSFVIALDERGQQFSSVAFSQKLDDLALNGRSHVTLIIGGSAGLAPEIRERADLIWSLSEATFPHEMVYLMVVEQLYRSMAITNGLPYHKA